MRDEDKDRGTGRTTQQMREAPQGALFIWPFEGSLYYPKHLARSIGRDDLKIVGVDSLDNYSLVGRTYTGIILDHAANLSPKRHDLYLMLLPLVR